MEIISFRTPGLGDQTYLVAHEGKAVLVDPQRDIDRFLGAAADRDLDLRFVLETHMHNDYVSGGQQAALAHDADGLVAAADRVDVVALAVEDLRHQVTERLVVFDQQDLRRGVHAALGWLSLSARSKPTANYGWMSLNMRSRRTELPLPAERPFGDRKGRNRLFEDPLRTAGLREYRPGDPLRRIDWKATARSGELRSRVYDPSATQQLYLLVNIDTMAHAWEGYLEDELESTVSVAASVATWAAGARYAVGILANGAYPDADRPIRLAPSRSRDQLARVLEALAVIQPLTMGDLAGAISRESGRLPTGSTLVLVASLIPPQLAGILLRLAGEGHRVAIITTSERAAAGAPSGIPLFPLSAAVEWSASAATAP